ncbi:hypothetical protein EVAR_27512_1 [Eumeta japonica]|uniref:Uncharacterized protein n=1 Tax=Eumeta variegata TaxID=151549 RepID=A0A4C1XHF1_EUMVA|nr:hypothetical protein EVAR_27512_1 [Eumeta japonica]
MGVYRMAIVSRGRREGRGFCAFAHSIATVSCSDDARGASLSPFGRSDRPLRRCGDDPLSTRVLVALGPEHGALSVRPIPSRRRRNLKKANFERVPGNGGYAQKRETGPIVHVKKLISAEGNSRKADVVVGAGACARGAAIRHKKRSRPIIRGLVQKYHSLSLIGPPEGGPPRRAGALARR